MCSLSKIYKVININSKILTYISDQAKRAYQRHQNVLSKSSQIDHSNLAEYRQKCQNKIERFLEKREDDKQRMKEIEPLKFNDGIVNNISIKKSLHTSLPPEEQPGFSSTTGIKSRRKRYLRRRPNNLRVRRRLVRFQNMPPDSERAKNKEVAVGIGVRTVYSIQHNRDADNLPTNRKPMASPELLKLFPHLRN